MDGPESAELATLLSCPPELLDTTLDQLRTLAVVHATGNAQQAAKVLGRSQGSVQKQLDNLNETAMRLMAETLVAKQGRGKPFLFTSAGDEVVRLATATLQAWTDGIHRARRRAGSTITIGTTEFTVEFLGRIWPGLRDDFERRGIQLKIEHVRTRDLKTKLAAEQVDLVCGSFTTTRGTPPAVDYDFLEWHRESVALLTNLTTRELPDKPVTHAKLAQVPLLAPTAGLLADFLTRWYGPGYRGVLNIVADIDALTYGLNLLNSELMYGCLLTTDRVADAAIQGRLPGENLRKISLANDYNPPLEIVTGIFARPGECQRYSENHPLNILWNAFATASPNHTVTPALPDEE